MIDFRYKAASVPQCVLVSNARTDKVCICFVVSRCSQICWGKDLQSALTFSCRGDSTEIMLEDQQHCSYIDAVPSSPLALCHVLTLTTLHLSDSTRPLLDLLSHL